MQGSLVVGISLGCLIGIITGLMTLLILRDAFPPRGRRQASGIRLAAQISALPVFWLGGTWLTTVVVRDIDWKELRGPYLVALLAIYFLIIAVPLVRLIAQVAKIIR